MRIKNLSKNCLIIQKAKLLSSLWEKSIGLLDPKIEAVIFKTRLGIHTIGMKTPIDVIILDKNFKVVSFKKRLKPNRLFFWNIKFDLVVESTKPLIVDLGDKLKIYG